MPTLRSLDESTLFSEEGLKELTTVFNWPQPIFDKPHTNFIIAQDYGFESDTGVVMVGHIIPKTSRLREVFVIDSVSIQARKRLSATVTLCGRPGLLKLFARLDSGRAQRRKIAIAKALKAARRKRANRR